MLNNEKSNHYITSKDLANKIYTITLNISGCYLRLSGRNMARLRVFCLLLLMAFVVVAVAEATAKKPKKVKCQDKNYPACYHQNLYCPDSCLRTCVVDCVSCQPVCTTPPPPPRPLTPSPPAIPTPPTWHSPPPPASSGPSSDSAPKRVRCKNKYYPHCYFQELICPSSCPEQCDVDCVTCSPVCSKFSFFPFLKDIYEITLAFHEGLFPWPLKLNPYDVLCCIDILLTVSTTH